MTLTPAIRAALAACRAARQRMANATDDSEYLDAASALADAFNRLDQLLTGAKSAR